jgi:hypothetical protein
MRFRTGGGFRGYGCFLSGLCEHKLVSHGSCASSRAASVLSCTVCTVRCLQGDDLGLSSEERHKLKGVLADMTPKAPRRATVVRPAPYPQLPPAGLPPASRVQTRLPLHALFVPGLRWGSRRPTAERPERPLPRLQAPRPLGPRLSQQSLQLGEAWRGPVTVSRFTTT